MTCEKIDFGIFVLICLDENSYNQSERYTLLAQNTNLSSNKDIRFYRLSAYEHYTSASKLKNISRS